MNFAEQIQAFQLKRNELGESNRKLMEAAAKEGRSLDEEEKKTFDSNRTEIKECDEHLDRLREVEGQAAAAAHKQVVNGVGGRGTHVISRNQDPDDKFPGQSFVRRVIARSLAQLSQGELSAGQVAEHRWGKTHPMLVSVIPSRVSGSATTRWFPARSLILLLRSSAKAVTSG